MHKQWKVERSGSTIRLVNSWFDGSKLYIDGDLKDSDQSKLSNAKYPLLSGSFVNPDGLREVIEVYAKFSLFTVEFVMTSNGEEIFRG